MSEESDILEYKLYDPSLKELVEATAQAYGLSPEAYIERLLQNCMDAGLVKPPANTDPELFGAQPIS